MKNKIALLLIALPLSLCGCGKSGQSPGTAGTAATDAASAVPPSAAPDAPPGTAHMDAMPHLPATVADWARGAMLFGGLGDFHRPITTSSAEAQKYFDQGLRLAWAFNHDEATRSFAKAAEIDPSCAICFWGVSLTVGPNYNLPMLIEERAQVASEALAKAQANAAHASAVEQALIGALAQRYPPGQPVDPAKTKAALIAYADAMKTVAQKFPQDLDVQTFYAEALMNTNAWKLWTPDHRAAPGTDIIVATLESVLARDPAHPGANHYYVHAIEASPHPEKATASAERLKDAMPAAGHLVHMPAHIMQRIGRYEEAAEANRRAAVADEAYARSTQAPDYYVMYTAHNYQFLAYSTAMQGRKVETLAAADNSRKVISDDMLLAMPGADWYVAEIYSARIRFGLWDDMLAMPAPNPKLPGLTGAFLYGRAVALVAKGRVDEARAAVADLQKLASGLPDDAAAGQNALKDVLAIAIPIAQARIAASEHRTDDATSLLRQAVSAEDRIAYDEPKNWFFPARQVLGAHLLQAGKPREAEAVYREDLQESPANGWSLFGLSAALEAQGRAAEAARVKQQFNSAWTRADVTLTASAY